jgi:GxxExxY protein
VHLWLIFWFCVNPKVIIEIKAVVALCKEHEVQLVNYLVATKINTGLLINFGESVVVRGKFREYKLRSS